MLSSQNVEQARFNMIEQQIRTWDVLDQGVLALLAIVKREDFVPAPYRSMAFVDAELPLPTGDGAAEIMLSPKVEARLLQELMLAKHESVLEVGAGSGHMAALLAHKARQVISLDIHSDPARRRLSAARRARSGWISSVVTWRALCAISAAMWPEPAPISSTLSCRASVSSCRSRASTLGDSIDSAAPSAVGKGSSASTKAIDRYGAGTKSSRLTIASSASTP